MRIIQYARKSHFGYGRFCLFEENLQLHMKVLHHQLIPLKMGESFKFSNRS